LCRFGRQGIAAAEGPTGLPRIGLVFSLWQCDKKNHGWREGPPLTVPCQSLDLLPGLHPPGIVSFERKKNTAFRRSPRPSLTTLAGYFARLAM
jgi:hypothetical protein